MCDQQEPGDGWMDSSTRETVLPREVQHVRVRVSAPLPREVDGYHQRLHASRCRAVWAVLGHCSQVSFVRKKNGDIRVCTMCR